MAFLKKLKRKRRLAMVMKAQAMAEKMVKTDAKARESASAELGLQTKKEDKGFVDHVKSGLASFFSLFR